MTPYQLPVKVGDHVIKRNAERSPSLGGVWKVISERHAGHVTLKRLSDGVKARKPLLSDNWDIVPGPPVDLESHT